MAFTPKGNEHPLDDGAVLSIRGTDMYTLLVWDKGKWMDIGQWDEIEKCRQHAASISQVRNMPINEYRVEQDGVWQWGCVFVKEFSPKYQCEAFYEHRVH